jgi:hypothetical protein
MLHLSALLLCLALAWPQTAGAQDPRLEARLDSTTRARVERVLAAARDDGLPTEPLVQKALEGASKGAAGARIAAAVESMMSDLRSARQALGRGAAPGDLVAAAAAMRAGATPAMVGEMRRLAPRGGVAVPLAVFTDLVAGGMTVDTAWHSVDELARNGGDPQEFLDLRNRLGPGRAP